MDDELEKEEDIDEALLSKGKLKKLTDDDELPEDAVADELVPADPDEPESLDALAEEEDEEIEPFDDVEPDQIW